MISYKTAGRLGAKFLRKEKCFKLADGIERRRACLDETFKNAVQTLGKKKVAELYDRLPQQLKDYVLWDLCPKSDRRFNKKFMAIWDAYTGLTSSERPNRRKEFKNYYREAEEALLQYLGARK